METTNHNFLKNLRRFFKFFDLYGQNVTLFINKKPKFHTTCSGFISMGVISFVMFTFMGFINSWLNMEKITPIPSSLSKSVLELLSENKTYEYELGYKNYPFYWSFSSYFPDGTDYEIPDLNNYFTYNVTFSDDDTIRKEMMTEPCKIDQQDIFIGLDQKTIDQDVGKTAIYRICIRDDYKVGIFPNVSRQTLSKPNVYFSLFQCVNSTDNNNSCASQKAIDEVIKYAKVQATVPTTIYDFQNPKKSQKNFYDYIITMLDKSMLKSYQNQLIPSNIYMDDGILYEDYQLQSTNFNPNINYDPNLRKDDIDPLYVFKYDISFKTQNYFLRNQKINEIAGNLGGLFNAIFLIGKLICMAYNSINLRFKMINSTFLFSVSPENLPNSSKVSMANSKISAIAKRIRNFSFSYFFPSKEVRMFYLKGSKYLHEYMDIRRIIKRLQDLDKLKMILLTEDQRKLFECIPKPGVDDSINEFSLKSINKFKETTKTGTTSHYVKNTLRSMSIKNDPVNLRILDCIDGNLKVEPDNYGRFYCFYLFDSKNIRKWATKLQY